MKQKEGISRMVMHQSTTSQTTTRTLLAVRPLPAVVALLLVFSAALLFRGTALAAPSSSLSPSIAGVTAPWKATSYYVSSNSTSTAYTHGCDQANLDDSHGSGSMVVLDFGGQTSGGGGTVDFSNSFRTNATIESLGESFSHGYNHCASASSSQLLLALGTNNSIAVSSSLGNIWSHVVADVVSYDGSQGYSRVSVIGADDMEPGFGSASAARSWASGFNTGPGGLYDDYGSADGCPPAGGTCNNGWTQADEYYLAWGNPAAIATPEIYVSTMAWQWEDISLYGVNSGKGPVGYLGSMATPGSGFLTAADAFVDFQNALNSHASTSVTLSYSLYIQFAW